MQNWDYRWHGVYFITICTKFRKHYFGEIINGKMVLSPAGIIADILWHDIKNHTINIESGEFVVMPNHIHGILIFNVYYKNDGDRDNGKNHDDGDGNNGDGKDGIGVQTGHALSLQPTIPSQPTIKTIKTIPPHPSHPIKSIEHKTIGQQRFQNIGKNSVSSIIGSYKAAVTKHIHRLGFKIEWQERFYEHIIHDNAEHQRIQNYILNNPAKWEKDKLFSTWKHQVE